jgi:hypothetical protein
MPAKAGDRDRMERLMTSGERVTLAAQCRAARVPLDRWHRCKGLARPWELLVVERLARRIAAAEGMSEARAFDAAATRLRLPPDTLVSRRKDWPAAAFGASRHRRSA